MNTPARSGNRKLKRALFLSAFAVLHDPTSRAYKDRKRTDGRKRNAALICLANNSQNAGGHPIPDAEVHLAGQSVYPALVWSRFVRVTFPARRIGMIGRSTASCAPSCVRALRMYGYRPTSPHFLRKSPRYLVWNPSQLG